MKHGRTSQETEKANTIEEAYRRGYHHGLSHALDLVHNLLLSDIPVGGVVFGRGTCTHLAEPKGTT